MECAKPTVLAIGATGKFANLVVPELVKRKATVRALVRDDERAMIARSIGASEIALGDLRNRDSLLRAVTGVDAVFHIGPAFALDEAALGVALVEAAEQAGVKKFVFSSVIQPTNTRLKNHASKVPVEDAIYSSKLQYTILHPANFMQNISFAWTSILDRHAFSEPFPADVKIARVDYRDVAEIAAIALTQDTLAFATLELSAGMYNRVEIAAALSDELGYPIEPLEPSFGEWVKEARLPYSDHQIHLLSKVHEHYRSFGLGGNSLTLKAALGRNPRSLREYIRDLVNASTKQANKG
ncbi:NmrA/HSCARG family protein [Phyllobacterium sp. SB3]|uniref:NmrA/HSCARG family protein n=1 Tax=Phyllobacterium sp. SB3 TaxID=3156073 RepID=UPI0032AEC970